MTERTVESITRAHLERKAETLAADLEHLAKSVRSDAERFKRVGTPGVNSYAAVVSNIQHTIAWGVVNLGIDRFTSEAYEADKDRIIRAQGTKGDNS